MARNRSINIWDNKCPKPRGKRLGQVFIQDIASMRHAISFVPKLDDNILEIGGGSGKLSDIILDCWESNIVILEIDNRCVMFLKQKYKNNPRVTISSENFLEPHVIETLHQQMGPIQLIANLPYNITNEFLLHLFLHIEKYSQCAVMLQKEVGIALTTSKLSKIKCILTSIASIRLIQVFNKNAFYPKPKVDSAFLLISPLEEQDRLPLHLRQAFLEFIEALFANKKQILKHNKCFQKLQQINPQLNEYKHQRLHTLSIAHIKKLFPTYKSGPDSDL